MNVKRKTLVKKKNIGLRSVFLLAALIFYSCSASDSSKNSDMSFEDIKVRVNESSERLLSLDAEGEISIDSPELSNTGSITVSINKPDSIFTKLEGPFGIDVADLLITRKDFIYYNVRDNKVIRGVSSPSNLRYIMKVNVSFDELINAFSGKYTFTDDDYEDAKVSTEGNDYVVSLKSGKESRIFRIDKKSFFVTKIGTYDEKGNTKIEIIYENFYEKDGIYFPKNISISRPAESQNIWLTYYSEQFNKNKLTYKLKIPKSAKTILWK